MFQLPTRRRFAAISSTCLVLVSLLGVAECIPDDKPQSTPLRDSEEVHPAETITVPTVDGSNPGETRSRSSAILDVSVTPQAAREVRRHVRELRNSDPTIGSLYLRLRVVPGGCTGFQNKLDIDSVTAPDDHRIETQGIVLVVDRKTALTVSGSVIDFVDTPEKRGFTVTNPNAKPRCNVDETADKPPTEK